jgi:dihydrofolate reductase
MKKIVLYTTVSLDGYMARKDKNSLLIESFTNLKSIDKEFPSFYDSIDTVLMGDDTYQNIIFNEYKWLFSFRVSYVISKKNIKISANDDIRFIAENPIPCIRDIKNKNGRDIWVIGGGELISSLLKHNLIDEIILLYIPTLISDGVPLFSNNYEESQWSLLDCHFYENGIIKVRYALKS